MTKSLNLVGKKFGQLTVVDLLPNLNSERHRMWACVCSCGKKLSVRTTLLVRNKQNYCHKCAVKKSGETRRLSNDAAVKNHCFSRYISSTKERGYVFILNREQFLSMTQERCHYCNSLPYGTYKHYRHTQGWKYNGIDRKDNTQGVTLQNSVPCCKICNRAKNGMDYVEFKSWIDRIKRDGK